MPAHVIYQLRGRPRRKSEEDPLIREIDLSHIPLHTLQHVFHVGPANILMEGRRHIGKEKAEHLQSYCSETIDTETYEWEFHAKWSDEN
jgi:hypothetical protein